MNIYENFILLHAQVIHTQDIEFTEEEEAQINKEQHKPHRDNMVER